MQIDIRFVRHAHADHAANDRDRQMTRAGREQAVYLGINWLEEGFQPTLVISSAAPRAVETCRQAIGRDPIELEELYFGTNPDWTGPMEAAFKVLGNAPLTRYDDSVAGVAVGEYANAASDAIRQIILRTNPLPTQVAVFGHAMFLPAVARHMFLFYGTEEGTSSSIVLEECGVISGVLTKL